MKTDYEKAIEWLNKKAEKAGGITNLGKTVGAPASTFFRVLKGGSPPGADKLLDWISQLGGKIVFPDERMEGYTLIPKVVAKPGRVVAHHFGRGSGDGCLPRRLPAQGGRRQGIRHAGRHRAQHGADDPP
ncbi:MAG: hypothetical protein ACLR7Z_12430 [Bilophila wadsworthia]